MRKHIGLILAVAVVIVIAAALHRGRVLGPADPLPTFEPLPSYSADDAQLAAPADAPDAPQEPQEPDGSDDADDSAAGSEDADDGSYGYDEYTLKFYPETTTAELSPKLPDMILPDFTDMEETYPLSFGKDNVGGRRVIAYNTEEYAEAYMTYVNGGVWAIVMKCAFADRASASAEFRDFLTAWVVPVSAEEQPAAEGVVIWKIFTQSPSTKRSA
ncbi:MAG: hypothetical protein LBC38_01830 [Oscillospiraceae bacterium]|jgi:hypothetical protein|nr:hypothetical protein [Oscillospiraceae bacterium]